MKENILDSLGYYSTIPGRGAKISSLKLVQSHAGAYSAVCAGVQGAGYDTSAFCSQSAQQTLSVHPLAVSLDPQAGDPTFKLTMSWQCACVSENPPGLQ